MLPLFSLPPLNGQEIGVWVAAALTLVILSAALGENRLSRAGFALFIGLAVGYAGAIIWQAVLWPRILLAWRDPLGQWPLLVWFGLGLLLLTRGLTSASWLSNVSLAYLIAVGAALAMGGALLGTAVPQLAAIATGGQAGAASWPAVANGLLLALGTGGVLFRFAYTGWGGDSALGKLWARLISAWGKVGYGFIVVAMGALFATAIVSFLTLLASRFHFLLAEWLRLAAP